MDRTCDPGAQGPGRGHPPAPRRPGGFLRLGVAVVLAGTTACGTFGTDLDQIVALEIRFSGPATVEQGDTIQPFARALNGRGDSVAATITWAALDTLIVQVVDSNTGATLGKKPGSGRIQARVGALRSNPVAVVVNPDADTLFAAGPPRDTVTAATSADSLSDSLKVQLQDLPAGGTPVNLANRLVTFQITYPIGGAGFTLEPSDSLLTGTGGIAAVRVRLLSRTLPDSAVVTAGAFRANGQPVPGSVVTFVVEFVP